MSEPEFVELTERPEFYSPYTFCQFNKFRFRQVLIRQLPQINISIINVIAVSL